MSNRPNIAQRIFRILLTMAAYGYLLYILLTYKDYSLFLLHFQTAGPLNWAALLLCTILLPLNIFLEAWKWRYLLKDIEPISLREAQAQVYYGFLGAFITPQRLGDYPTRATRLSDKKNWLPAITLGFIGSMALTIVNILAGIIPLFRLGNDFFPATGSRHFLVWALLMVAFCLLLIVLIPAIARFLLTKKTWGTTMQTFLLTLGRFSIGRFSVLILQSLCRYIVFAAQLALVLYFCGAGGRWLQMLFIAIPLYYALITVLPSIPAADAAIRGSVATFCFGLFTDKTAVIAIAVIILWAINTLIPMICGTFVKKRK